MTALTSKALQHRSAAAAHPPPPSHPTTPTALASSGNHHHQHHHDRPSSSNSAADKPLPAADDHPHQQHSHHGIIGSAAKKMTPTARLRQLIVSNLHLQHNNSGQHAAGGVSPRSTPPQQTQQQQTGTTTTTTTGDTEDRGLPRCRTASGDSGGHESPSNQPRLPVEYLMYHHFGPVSVGRCRRLSDAPLPPPPPPPDPKSIITTPTSQVKPSQQHHHGSQDGEAAHTVATADNQKEASPSSGSSSTIEAKPSANTGLSSSTRTGSYTGPTASIGTILAGVTNEKQRHAQIYSIYKGYFKRINRHNLIIFTQSFLKRQSLNLRKDCGAAAHAAAAAAALGASICSPFGPAQLAATARASTSGGANQRTVASTAAPPVDNVATTKAADGAAESPPLATGTPDKTSGGGNSKQQLSQSQPKVPGSATGGILRRTCHRLSSASRASSFASAGSGTSSVARFGGNLSGSNSQTNSLADNGGDLNNSSGGGTPTRILEQSMGSSGRSSGGSAHSFSSSGILLSAATSQTAGQQASATEAPTSEQPAELERPLEEQMRPSASQAEQGKAANAVVKLPSIVGQQKQQQHRMTTSSYNRSSTSITSAASCATTTTTSATTASCATAPVLVAGTKVKKTFTCHTLIMCSSVSTHCDHALSLMSKLNPLQSTWIKTDCLLVLEERPDKVCQALRLFLQGIGYSMSGYEKRLRLTRNSANSAANLGAGPRASSAQMVAPRGAAGNATSDNVDAAIGQEEESATSAVQQGESNKNNNGTSASAGSGSRHFSGHMRRRQSSVPS